MSKHVVVEDETDHWDIGLHNSEFTYYSETDARLYLRRAGQCRGGLEAVGGGLQGPGHGD
jgi:hypothetical protein